MSWKMEYLSEMSSGLGSMLQSEKHTDVNIIVDGQVFHCHKVVLGSISPYFDAMFSHDFTELRNNKVTLHDIDAKTFSYVLDYIYCGKDVITDDNADLLLNAASLLQVRFLLSRSEEYLVDKVYDDNCVNLWKLAKMHNCVKLMEKTHSVMLEAFQSLPWEDLQSLDASELISLVSSNELNVTDEDTVCDTVIKWIDHDFDNRKTHIDELLRAIRLPLVTIQYLSTTLLGCDMANSAGPSGTVLIKEAAIYNSCSNRHSAFSSKRTLQRNTSKLNDVIVVIGGMTRKRPIPETTRSVICYSAQEKKWFELPDMPFNTSVGTGVCTHGDNIMLSGGMVRRTGFCEFNVHTNSWKVLESMTVGRFFHSMVSISNSIFSLGGRDSNNDGVLQSVEEYDYLTEEWKDAGQLAIGVSAMAVFISKDQIFTFGGHAHASAFKADSLIQVFNIKSKTSCVIATLPETIEYSSALAFDEHIIIVSPRKVIRVTLKELLQEANGQFKDQSDRRKIGKTVDELSEKLAFGAGIARLGGVIYAVGGYKNDVLKQIMVLEDETILDSVGMELPYPRFFPGCVNTIIRSAYLNMQIT